MADTKDKKKVLKNHVFVHIVAETDGKKQIPSPKRQKRFEGKESSRHHEWGLGGGGRLDFDEKEVFRPFSSSENVIITAEKLEFRSKNTPTDLIKIQRSDYGFSMLRRPLGSLLKGILPAMAPCHGCGGMCFVMCVDCNGSCKVSEDQKKILRCAECNGNGLIRRPICC